MKSKNNNLNNIHKMLKNYNINNEEIILLKEKNLKNPRAIYKINNNNKSYSFKKIYYNESELLFVYSAMKWCLSLLINVPHFLKSNDGYPYTKDSNGTLYVLSKWIDGERLDYDDIENTKSSFNLLAHLHIGTKKFFPIRYSKNRTGFLSLNTKKHRYIKHLNNYYNIAKNENDYFSQIFLECFEKQKKLLDIALLYSLKINYSNLNSSLCHLDFVNKNILIDKDNISVIDFDRCKFDYRIHDICYSLNRILKREFTNWDIPIFNELISTYNDIYTLNKDEFLYMICYLSMPSKFISTSKLYYSSKEDDVRKHAIKTLEKLSIRVDKKINFINHLEDSFL